MLGKTIIKLNWRFSRRHGGTASCFLFFCIVMVFYMFNLFGVLQLGDMFYLWLMAPCHSCEGRNLIEKAIGNIYGFMVEYNYFLAFQNHI